MNNTLKEFINDHANNFIQVVGKDIPVERVILNSSKIVILYNPQLQTAINNYFNQYIQLPNNNINDRFNTLLYKVFKQQVERLHVQSVAI